MADIVKVTDAIYALARMHRSQSDTLTLAMQLTQDCKPLLDELKKICPWPFGKAYQVPCDTVINTTGEIIERALASVEIIMINNYAHWRVIKSLDSGEIAITLSKEYLSLIYESLQLYYLYPESKKKIEAMMVVLLRKQNDLAVMDLVLCGDFRQ